MNKKFNYLNKQLIVILLYVFFILAGSDIIYEILFRMGIKDKYLFNALGNLLLYSILVIIYIFILNKELLYEIKDYFHQKNKASQLGLGFLILYGAGISGSILLQIIGVIETEAVNQKEIVLMLQSRYTLMVAAAVLIGPLVEEIVFRKAIFELFIDKWKFSPKVILVFSSIFFGLIHVVFNLNNDITELLRVIPYVFQGLALGYIYLENKRNIMYPTVVHLLNNLISILLIILVY